jgi:2-dehydropantoate 2-reductase
MRITVFGAGAVGSAVGGLLSKEHRVTLIARTEHVDAIHARGLHLIGAVDELFHPEARASVEGLGEQDLVLITTKAYDTAAAVQEIVPLVGRGTLVVSLQNGLGNMDILSAAFGPRAVVGVPFLGATYMGPGQVRLAGLGEIVLGSPSGRNEGVDLVREVLGGTGMTARSSDDIDAVVWLKAIVNASVNPITALVRRENGFILGSEELLELSGAACREGARAAEANGVALGCDDPFAKVLAVLRTTATNRSSMLQDVLRSKRTEIDQINGALVGQGEAQGVTMPVNRTLWALVRSL